MPGRDKDLDSIQEMAELYDAIDTQSLEWEDTDLKFERPDMAHVSIRIPQEDLLIIKKNARKLGLGYTAYIRMLLHQSISTPK